MAKLMANWSRELGREVRFWSLGSEKANEGDKVVSTEAFVDLFVKP